MNLDIESGARNLLLQCADVKPGESVLLIGESGSKPFFDPELCEYVAEVARALGFDTQILLAEPGKNASEFPETVTTAMQTADVTIFFSRLGDQVRFVESPGPGRKIMTYTLTQEHLGSMFSIVDYQMMKRVHDDLLQEIKNSEAYTISAPNGTELSATITQVADSDNAAISEFSLDLFPVMIFPPLNFHKLNGKLVLEHFLLSSSTRAYTDSELHLDTDVTVYLENCYIVGFEGEEQLIEKVQQQLKRAAAITGGDPYRLNSWHTGINPYTFFQGDPYSDLERWGTVAYGSPRYTHIHAAGNDPGDISIQLFDASISFDNKVYWDHGRFVYLDQPETQVLLDQSRNQRLDSSTRLSIGM